MTPEQIIRILKLEPLPEEGGFYREIYRSTGSIPEKILGGLHQGERNYGTHIFYLITPEEFSALHRLPQDELFHFYLGDPVEMFQIDPDGNANSVIFGNDLTKNQTLFHRVKPNTWQGTRLLPGGKGALLGCTVIPGFDFRDFELQTRAQLVQSYPQHKENIMRFTR
ncbi:MAG: hypothetical protein A3I05_09635 [Deltaproteobacteria bacterium RIFCSPLOWO2_02_FULL_44_10]|nr:MAG: hypothetical protein A3C46_00090 [Deltaproteobacteria bacterium RIFCSPHIGHO2_02_FULL_44_16]OGQ46826.1 MAG: hypothetical protein A3I05_09635 [Deltaproteobacteria bacterium RIFCSPLOWO2_02_FULL_44_10]